MYVLLQKAMIFEIALNCNNIYILDDSGTITRSFTITTRSVSLNTYVAM